MKRTTLDLWVGFFVAIGFLALVFLAFKVGNLSGSNFIAPYTLKAKYENIGGLKVRGAVKSSGVVIGRISDISIDPKTYEAIVSFNVDGRYRFPKDTIAAIYTSGLLGEQYVGLDVGGDEKMLEPGDTIFKTQSAVVLEKMIGQFLFNKAAEDQPKK